MSVTAAFERARPTVERRPAARPRPAGRTILLTGGSGVVGQALLPTLADSTTICLVHRSPVSGPNVECLPGDIAAPRLGLSRTAFADLASRIDCIIHSAAVTHFGQAEDAIRCANVEGTANVLELAARARVPVYHVSTAFVRVRSHSTQEPNAYELSKRDGDELVRTSGLPAAILRPSLVIGDSATGQIARFQGIYLMLGMFLKGLLPVVPAREGAIADFIPQDVVADAIAGLVARGIRGGEYWLTAGDSALTVGSFARLCAHYAEHLLGRAITLPRFVAPDIFDRLIKPVFLPELPGRYRRVLDRAAEVARYMNVERRFPSSLERLESDIGAPLRADPELALLHSLEHWARATGLVGRPEGDAARAAADVEAAA